MPSGHATNATKAKKKERVQKAINLLQQVLKENEDGNLCRGEKRDLQGCIDLLTHLKRKLNGEFNQVIAEALTICVSNLESITSRKRRGK